MIRFSNGLRARGLNYAVCVIALGVASAATPAQAAQPAQAADLVAADQQAVGATDRLLSALAKWERLSPAARASAGAALTQLAQERQDQLLQLLQKNPRQAAARMMPRALRDRLPAQAAAYVEQEVTLQGTVFAHVADDFAKGTSRTDFKFSPDGGGTLLALYLADAAGNQAELVKWAGRKVSLSGMRIATHLAVLDRERVQVMAYSTGTTTTATGPATGTRLAAASTPSVVQGNQNVLSILVNFNDAALSCTASDIEARLFGASGSTVNNEFRESSRGLVSFSGKVTGPYTINYSASGSCEYLGWAAAAEAAAKAAGVDPAQYGLVNYVTPANPSCGWQGIGSMPGRQSWAQSCSVTALFSHEFGHNLSLDHAATPTYEYGDGSDPMGGTQLVDINGANRTMAGWMPSASLMDVSTGGSYALATISTNAAAASPQVLRLAKADTGEYYYVSLREALNLDGFLALKYLDTVTVHRASGTLPAKTYLLQNLTAGQSFSDTVNGISITNQGTSNGTATVAITLGQASCVRNAPLVSVAPASQAGAPGSTLAYTVSVTNQNGSACPSSSFGLAQALPAGFSGTFGAASLSIAPGATATSTWSVASASTLSNATYTLSATATDASSGAAASAVASDIVYGSSSCTPGAPVVTVSPSSQSGAPGTTLPYTVTVTNGNSSGCAASTFNLGQGLPSGFSGQIGATSLSLAPGASASSAWSVTPGSSVGTGTYALSATAADASAGTTAVANAAATVVMTDTTPPTLAILSPTAGATLGSRSSVSLSATASDASGVQAVEFYVDGSLLVRDTSTPYSASWNPRKVAKGAHTILVRAVDKAGNVAAQSISVTVQ